MTGATMFSGIGCPEVALPEIDWLWCAEVDPFACRVLKHRHPGIPNLGDVTATDFIDRAMAHGSPDVFIFGSPCQAFSVAGLRKSLDDARGNLTLRSVEIIDAINPGTILWENVPGVLSTKDNAFGCFLGALVGADAALEPAPFSERSKYWSVTRKPYRWVRNWIGGWDTVAVREAIKCRWPDAGVVAGPKRNAAWRVLDAQYFGLAQRRRRVFVVASPTDRPHPAEILFERDGLQRYSAPRRETGQGTAGSLAARTRGGGGLGTDFECGGASMLRQPSRVADAE